MTDEEFAVGVDAILLTGATGHASHRALDLLWTRYAIEKGGPLGDATRKWMAAIEGDHTPGEPYPLGSLTWWQRPLLCKLGLHPWRTIHDESGWGLDARQCDRCGLHEGAGNPCP